MKELWVWEPEIMDLQSFPEGRISDAYQNPQIIRILDLIYLLVIWNIDGLLFEFEVVKVHLIMGYW